VIFLFTYGCTSYGVIDLPHTVTRSDNAGADLRGLRESMSFTYTGSMTTGVTFSGMVDGSLAWTFDINFRVTSESVNGDTIDNIYDNDRESKTVVYPTITRDGRNVFLTWPILGLIVHSFAYSTFEETCAWMEGMSLCH